MEFITMKLSAATSIIFIASTFLPAEGTGVLLDFFPQLIQTMNLRLNRLRRIHMKQILIIVWLIVEVRQTLVAEVQLD